MIIECSLRLTHPVAEKFLKLDNLTPDKHECYASYQKQKKDQITSSVSFSQRNMLSNFFIQN